MRLPLKVLCMHCVANDLQKEAQRARDEIEEAEKLAEAEKLTGAEGNSNDESETESDEELAKRLQFEELKTNDPSSEMSLEDLMGQVFAMETCLAKEKRISPSGSGSSEDEGFQKVVKKTLAKTPEAKSTPAIAQRSNEELSRKLSTILRHKAQEMGLPIRSDGYVPLKSLVTCRALRKFSPSFQDLQREVECNPKARFSMIKLDGEWYMRADQGHSMDVVKSEDLLECLHKDSKDLPEWVVHGTRVENWPSIQERGLLAGGLKGTEHRNHVHFALGLPSSGVISGCLLYTSDAADE